MSSQSATGCESDGIEPELGRPVARLDVYMDRLDTVARIEEEPKPSDAENCRHRRAFCRGCLLDDMPARGLLVLISKGSNPLEIHGAHTNELAALPTQRPASAVGEAHPLQAVVRPRQQ